MTAQASPSLSPAHREFLDAFDRDHDRGEPRETTVYGENSWEDFQFFGATRCRKAVDQGDRYYKEIASVANPIAAMDDCDYQGTKVFFIEQDGRFGVLSFGYGSCSGCDALEAAYSDEGCVEEVVRDILKTAQWADTFAGLVELAAQRDWAACEAISFDHEPVAAICRDLARGLAKAA